jgi:mannose-6-phosphate isomerase-like protein (cupin superfamily)
MATIKSPGDFAAQRRAWSEAEPRSVVTHRDEVEHIEFGGQDIAVLVSGEDTAGEMAVFEIVAQRGAGAPPHHQIAENEYWYIVEGEWEVRSGDKTATVGPGSIVLNSAGVTHAFKLISDQPGRMLTINAPAGHELFFRHVAKSMETKTPPDQMIESVKNYEVVF